MDNSEFLQLSDTTLEKLARRLDALALDDMDVVPADGKLTVEFDDHPFFIISRQSATQQLWLAEPQGGWHFNYQQGEWICDKKRVNLTAMLESLISAKTGESVRL